MAKGWGRTVGADWACLGSGVGSSNPPMRSLNPELLAPCCRNGSSVPQVWECLKIHCLFRAPRSSESLTFGFEPVVTPVAWFSVITTLAELAERRVSRLAHYMLNARLQGTCSKS